MTINTKAATLDITGGGLYARLGRFECFWDWTGQGLSCVSRVSATN